MRFVAVAVALIIATHASAHGARSEAARGGGAPLPSGVPWSWVVTKDFLADPATCEALGKKVGARLLAVRNTTFDVGGGRALQVNSLVVESPGGVRSLELALRAGHGDKDRVVRDGEVLFEVVQRSASDAEASEAVASLRKSARP